MHSQPPVPPGSSILYERLAQLEAENNALRTRALRAEEAQAELHRLLNQHPHTGLPIRRVFDRDLAKILEDGNGPVGIAIVRLDKAYDRIRNSRDRSRVLLFKTALRIQGIVGEEVYQSDRLDEFFVIVRTALSPQQLAAVGRDLARAVGEPHEPPAADVVFGAHVGLTWTEGGAEKLHELVGNAYIALNQAEGAGEEYLLYTTELGRQFRRIELLEKELRRAVQNGFAEFSMVYQPFVNRSGRITGAEALIRWNSAAVGSIGPERFIPLAEETGDIRLIGQRTLYHSLRELVRWQKRSHHPIHMSVNLSSTQFKERDLVDRVEGVLRALRLDGNAVKLELTETAIMQDPVQAIAVMERLREQGVSLSIDDFGTGYSSLSYLKEFPVQTVKIDKSFVEGIGENVNNQEIIKAIISMAKNLHMETLAEGVETQEQLNFLMQEGCDHVQGYYFSPPVESATFAEYLEHDAVLLGGMWTPESKGGNGAATAPAWASGSRTAVAPDPQHEEVEGDSYTELEPLPEYEVPGGEGGPLPTDS